MKDPNYYRAAVEWIAYNDEPAIRDAILITEQLTILLVSDVFGVAPYDIAKEVVKIRSRFK